jgi:hypothetical protein
LSFVLDDKYRQECTLKLLSFITQDKKSMKVFKV